MFKLINMFKAKVGKTNEHSGEPQHKYCLRTASKRFFLSLNQFASTQPSSYTCHHVVHKTFNCSVRVDAF